MAVDYTRFFNGELKYAELAARYTLDELRDEVHRLYDITRAIVDNSTDAAIAFIPDDPDANDESAENEAERYMGWSLGHLVGHVTATNEEAAVFTSLLARGIQPSGRLRTETPWREINTVERAVQRLEESRRIVLAYLDAVPDAPRLDVLRVFSSERAAAYFGDLNAPASLLVGLAHHAEHIPQMEATWEQARQTLTAHI